LFEEGLENVFRRHRLLAEAVRLAIGAWVSTAMRTRAFPARTA
jgi:aspartate aminotransferase-like enzyme